MSDRRPRLRGAIAADAGGWLVSNPRFHGDKPGQTEARAVAFLRSFKRMGYAAVNVGAHEMVLSPDKLKSLAKRHKVQLVSANIVPLGKTKPIFQPAVLKTVGGVTFGFFGLISASPQYYGELFAKRGFGVLPPVDAARAAVKVLKSNGAQVVVCLSALRRNEVELVAEKVPGVDLVLGSAGMQLTLQMSRLAHGYFADTYTKGKYVGEILLAPGATKNQWAAADLKGALMQQVADLRTDLRSLEEQRKQAGAPGTPLQLTAQTKQALQQQIVQRRAKLQRTTMELEDLKEGARDKRAGTMKMQMIPLNKEIADDKAVLAAVKVYKDRFPSKPGH